MSKLTRAALALLILAGGTAQAQPIDSRTQARIDRILRATPLIDGHNDLPEQLEEDYARSVEGLESGTAGRPQPLMTDIARLRAGRVGGQFWSVWIDGTFTGDLAIRRTIEQIDIVTRLLEAYPRDFELALTASDVVRIHKTRRIASLIGVEGGRQMGGSMAALRQFHRLGARYMTLVHNETSEWADSATDDPKHGGLNPFGLEVVKEMNRLGMLVDLSHVTAEAMKDAIAATRAPVIFSHSNAQALNPHPRNVPDDVLRLLPDNGGLVMVNFVPRFVSPGTLLYFGDRSAEEARLKAIHPDSSDRVKQAMDRWDAARPRPIVTVAEVADHIDHIARVAGHDHVGIGGDLDGITYAVQALEGADRYPLLFAELIHRGWSDANLARLAGGNVLRVMRRAEAVAASMHQVAPSMAVLDPAK